MSLCEFIGVTALTRELLKHYKKRCESLYITIGKLFNLIIMLVKVCRLPR